MKTFLINKSSSPGVAGASCRELKGASAASRPPSPAAAHHPDIQPRWRTPASPTTCVRAPARGRPCSFCPVAPLRVFFSARVATRAGATRADRLAYSSRVRAYAGAGAVRAPARRAHRRERGEDAPTTPSTARVRASLALNPLRLGRRGRRGPGRARQAPPPRGAARPERHPGATGARVPHGASPPQGRQLRRARRPRPTVGWRACGGDRRPGYRAGEPRVEYDERLGRAQPRDPQRGAYAIPPRVVSPFPRTTTTPQTTRVRDALATTRAPWTRRVHSAVRFLFAQELDTDQPAWIEADRDACETRRTHEAKASALRTWPPRQRPRPPPPRRRWPRRPRPLT